MKGSVGLGTPTACSQSGLSDAAAIVGTRGEGLLGRWLRFSPCKLTVQCCWSDACSAAAGRGAGPRLCDKRAGSLSSRGGGKRGASRRESSSYLVH